MPAATIEIYEIPADFIRTTAPQTLRQATQVSITDDDDVLHGTPTADPGADQVFTTAEGVASAYQIIFDTTLTYTPDGATQAVTVPVKILSLTVNGALTYYVMAADAPSIPGLSAGATVQRSSPRSGYTPVLYGDIACFGAGTLIRTVRGDRPVEHIRVGDLVETADHGPQPVRWVGRTRLTGVDLDLRPEFRPLRVRAGALGRGLPRRDLLLSPQHRVLLTGWPVELACGEPELLSPVKHLDGWRGVSTEPLPGGIVYHHLMFDRHEIIFAEDLPAESFYLGDRMKDALNAKQAADIQARLPQLSRVTPIPARPFARSFEVTALIETAQPQRWAAASA